MRIATLADIHGNLPALEAVQEDLRQQGVEEVWLLGDQISRVPWDNEVLDLCVAEGWQGIFGNHELVIGQLGTPEAAGRFADRDRFIALYWSYEQMRPAHLAAIRTLPDHLVVHHDGLPSIYLTHAIPGNPFRGVFHDSPDGIVAEEFSAVQESIAIVGHTHRPLDRRVNGTRILNGGAVGLPYNGDMRAQYLILEEDGSKWKPIFRQVEYDNSLVEEAFVATGMAAAMGAYGTLHLRTAITAQPWSSDFAWWLGKQPAAQYASVDDAVAGYLQNHGPDNWAFKEEGA